MKKAFIVSIIIILSICLLTSCTVYPDLGDVEIEELDYEDIGYRKSTGWEHAQGLTTDGTNFYFAGHNDETDEDADIHIIDANTTKDVTTLKRAGSLHSAELAYNKDTDTVFTCSGGDGRVAYMEEINKTTGEKLGRWNFDDNGALIAHIEGYKFVLLTSSQDGAVLNFRFFELKPNGEHILEKYIHFEATDLGVPQGLEYYNGYVYYLADAGRTVNKNPHYIYKLDFSNDSLDIVKVYSLKHRYETEGMCIAPDGTLYFGNAKERIYKVSKSIKEL